MIVLVCEPHKRKTRAFRTFLRDAHDDLPHGSCGSLLFAWQYGYAGCCGAVTGLVKILVTGSGCDAQHHFPVFPMSLQLIQQPFLLKGQHDFLAAYFIGQAWSPSLFS